jgi:2-oxoglutarate dehydrogenase E1 component
MELQELTSQQRDAIDAFGPNSWFVEELFSEYSRDPSQISEPWKSYFNNLTGKVDAKPAEAAANGGTMSLPVAMPLPLPGEEAIALKGVPAKIVDNMSASLTIPTATTFRAIPVKLLDENRRIINQYLQKMHRGKVSFTHIIGWALVRALKKYPTLNSAFTVLEGQPHVIRKPHVHLGLAVDIEKKDGSRSLIVPNVKNAHAMSFDQYLAAYDQIIRRARTNKIEPSDFAGTTLTLTNPGTVGTIASNPRLMIGQGAIIATGAIEYPAEFHAMSEPLLAQLGIGKVMNMTSTYDHRIIQGAESGLFLQYVHQLLLGGDKFYDEIFSALRLPVKPAEWAADRHPSVFGGSQDFELFEKHARVWKMINMFRVRGHLLADLDPLTDKMQFHPELDSSTYGFTVWDFDRTFITDGLGGMKTAKLKDILEILHQTYCDKIGVEFRHIQSPEEKEWLQVRMESTRNQPQFDSATKKRTLSKLVIAENFEKFIHTKFVGHKRFSLEGSETTIPLLDYLVLKSAEGGVKEIVLGMAHRGRLNVLANIIGKPYYRIFSEFEGYLNPDSPQGSGDVKYHLGATGSYPTPHGAVIVSVAPNPSHLEFVNPVVEGIVRAKQTRMPQEKNKAVMAVLIHGDAAFAGQGVVAETLNLSQLIGYRTRGTIHVIINNQIGFTTTPEDSRSSTYATDVARMVQAPIFHVNGDDPEATLWVTQLAFEYRQKFEKDVVIDVYGYRRHGHNEGDEPGYTQPLMYQTIKEHPSVMKIYAERLIREEVVTAEEFDGMQKALWQELSDALDAAKRKAVHYQPDTPLAITQRDIQALHISSHTYVTEEQLNHVIRGLTTVPDTFAVHPKLQNFIDQRRKVLDGRGDIDWAFGEALAFGTLMLEGVPVRLSGEDVVRGTFSQRHLSFTDIHTGQEYFPLNHMDPQQVKLEAVDSALSETAVLGFEFGYAISDPLALVLWEAQFGDFGNVAQPIIDNFIVSSYAKWQLPNHLVMLLPHGYEGQGPEHSSARLERFLTLCAEDNMIVCNLTTPAQYFHALRRQMTAQMKQPLIIMTPKSLLRLPEARSPKSDFTSGQFHELLDDATVDKNKIRKVILCSGKVYYDLNKHRFAQNISDVAIVRVEQFYPYHRDMWQALLSRYTRATDVVWTQEEPQNMGAWTFMAMRLPADLPSHMKLSYAGRPAGAAPAAGSLSVHQVEQEKLIRQAFA